MANIFFFFFSVVICLQVNMTDYNKLYKLFRLIMHTYTLLHHGLGDGSYTLRIHTITTVYCPDGHTVFHN